MKIAIQGELGSFSHEAARTFITGSRIIPCATSRQVFEFLKMGKVNAAMIPIENSLAGAVAEHYDLLVAHDFFISEEHRLRIRHNLIALPQTKLKDITRVLSHPVALDQCRNFFRANPQIKPVPFYDTAGSVKHVILEKLIDAAGIASSHAATVYGGKILKSGLEDDKSNFTRFFLISKKRKAKLKANKMSLAFGLKNTPGALFKALSVFALRDISLSKIESRPMKGRPWEYVFFADILRGDDDATRNAIRHLGEVAEFVKILGIYPAAE